MVLGLLLFLFYIMLFPWVISFIPIVSLSFHVRHVHIYFLIPDHPASVSYIQLPTKPSTWHLIGNSNSTFPKLNLWCAPGNLTFHQLPWQWYGTTMQTVLQTRYLPHTNLLSTSPSALATSLVTITSNTPPFSLRTRSLLVYFFPSS